MENSLFLTNAQVGETLAFLKTMGYTEVRFPGGTDKNGDHYSGVIIYKYNPETKKIYFLTVPYNPNFYKTNPDEPARKPKGENPQKTAVREIYEEVGVLVKTEDLVELEKIRFVCKKNLSEGNHTKYFFVTSKFSGSPARFEAGNPIEAETASPLWIEGSQLKEVISLKHLKAFNESLNYLATQNKDLWEAMMNYLS